MSRITEQQNTNLVVKNELENVMWDYEHNAHCIGRLRTCSAEVYESATAYYLKSYNTMVAWIDKESSILYDALRLVWGYTATSAQHIAKFATDYRCASRYTYRN